MEVLSLLLAGSSAVFCVLCIRHGFKQHWGRRTAASRHFKQCAMAFMFGVFLGVIEMLLSFYKLMTPLGSLLIGSILNGIILIIMYHGVATLCIEMTVSEGKAEKKRSMRLTLWVGWVLIVAAYIPHRLSRAFYFYLIYEGGRSVLFIWFIFPAVLWYHRRSLEAPDFMTQQRMNLLKKATFLGMLHPLVLFVTHLTKPPLSPSLLLVLVMMVLFYFGYVTPDWFKAFLYRWLSPVPDEERLKYFTVLQTARDPNTPPSLLERWLLQFCHFLSLPAEQITVIVEASYLRGVGELPDSTASEALERVSFSRYERSADVAEFILGYGEAGNVLRYVWERWDGSGPHGLVGNEIPRESRILRVMEFFVGELHLSGNPREALEAVKAQTGEFDPDLVAALERMLDENGTS